MIIDKGLFLFVVCVLYIKCFKFSVNSQEDKILRDLGNPLRESKGPPRTTSKLWNTRPGLCALNNVGVLEFNNEGILPQVACLFLCRPVCLLITSVYWHKK
jgi:hypothetical protein